MTPEPTSSTPRSDGRGIVLIGYRGTGKSTVGRFLADRLGRPFVDADVRIESRAGRSISSIFAESGEPAFRDWEERVLAEITGENPAAVLATGGGAILRETNRLRLRTFGFVVWLQASPSELASRLSANPRGIADRPALTSAGTLDEISEILGKRYPLYEATADVAVDTEGRSPSRVAELIQDIWQNRGAGMDRNRQ
ncbi:MAG: shikimate kinase [Planctomycetes bacterium SCN 63-9]|mgnify:CR=1 FL=1|nr:MAG: shikimate kinase [Planctomycetes bacterium SCN 63-9]